MKIYETQAFGLLTLYYVVFVS